MSRSTSPSDGQPVPQHASAQQGWDGNIGGKEAIMTLLEKQKGNLVILQKVVDWLEAHPAAGAYTGNASVFGGGLDFDCPATRETVSEIFRMVGAQQWEKEIQDDKITYITHSDGMRVRVYKAPPPPSCHLEYDEVEVPAQEAKIIKIP